jgi:hypothetical protein
VSLLLLRPLLRRRYPQLDNQPFFRVSYLQRLVLLSRSRHRHQHLRIWLQRRPLLRFRRFRLFPR